MESFMSQGFTAAAYVIASILFILSLGGLSNQESAKRSIWYGVAGMAIAVLATLFGPQLTANGVPWIIAAMVLGGGVGIFASRVVRMTQMPELVALMHSLVGLAAMLVGFANYIDPAAAGVFQGAEKTIHEVEIYVGILIAYTFITSLVVALISYSYKALKGYDASAPIPE